MRALCLCDENKKGPQSGPFVLLQTCESRLISSLKCGVTERLPVWGW